MNKLGADKSPFLFIIDFECKKPLVYPMDGIPDGILFRVNSKSNYRQKSVKKLLNFDFSPPSYDIYRSSFDKVMEEIKYGNSYLLNLCTKTEVNFNYSLKEIFHASTAKYKLYFDINGERFTVFSPEIFIQIKKSRIYAHPMKGTIDADIKNAEKQLLNNPKEKSEHYTIVDLIRNDLNAVAKEVTVKKYRYLDRLKTSHKSLLQTSSKISGKLPSDYNKKIGDILAKLLPAGSISGAPKRKTMEIIKDAELEDRGYYTGIMGYFDGERLDAGIMIRFIEQSADKFYYRSGGGITNKSDCREEYAEIINKIYVPIS